MSVLKKYNEATSQWEAVVIGKQGPSGTVAVNAPLTNSGTSTAAVLGVDYSALQDGRNVIINGGMDYWQRGVSSTSTNGYTADRWLVSSNVSSTSSTRQSIPSDMVSTLGGLSYYMDFAATIVSPAFGYSLVRTRIEDVRTLAGKTATISFYAKGATASTIGFRFSQNFGTGGSSAVDFGHTNVNLTTSWTRYTFTINIPSISGKTIGIDSTLDLLFDKHLGTDFASIGYTTLPNLAGVLSITGVQLEAGSQATQFKRAGGTIQGELAACQRYYFRAGGENTYQWFGTGPAQSSTICNIVVPLPTTFRVAATSVEYSTIGLQTYSGTGLIAITAATMSAATNNKNVAQVDLSVASGLTTGTHYRALANNSTSAYIGFSAEL